MRLPEKYQEALQLAALQQQKLPPTPSPQTSQPPQTPSLPTNQPPPTTNQPPPTVSLPPTQPVNQLPSQTSSVRTTLPTEQRSQTASVAAVGGSSSLPPATVSEPKTSVVKSGIMRV